MAKQINVMPKDPASGDGYSLIWVHAWSHTLADIQTMVDHLDANVQVVGPEGFVHLISRNVKR